MLEPARPPIACDDDRRLRDRPRPARALRGRRRRQAPRTTPAAGGLSAPGGHLPRARHAARALLRDALPAARRRAPRAGGAPARDCGRCTRGSRPAACAISTGVVAAARRRRDDRAARLRAATRSTCRAWRAPRPRGLGDEYLFRSAARPAAGRCCAARACATRPTCARTWRPSTFCVQVIADTKLAVDRAVVETWKVLADAAERRALALSRRSTSASSATTGAAGSTSTTACRTCAARIARASSRSSPAPTRPWAVGGTYLAFLRLAVDLPAGGAWRAATRSSRSAATSSRGCPIVGVGDDGMPRTDPAARSPARRSGRPRTTLRSPSRRPGRRPARARQPRPARQPPPAARRGLRLAADLPPGLRVPRVAGERPGLPRSG